VPVTSLIPLIAGVLLALSGLGEVLSSVLQVGVPIMRAISWRSVFAYQGLAIGRYESVILVVAVLVIASAVLLMIAQGVKSLLTPALILAGSCLAVQSLLWFVIWPRTFAVVGMIGGASLIVMSTVRLMSHGKAVWKLIGFIAIGLQFLALLAAVTLRAAPFAVFLVAMVLLVAALSSDHAKTYYQPPARPERVIVSARAVPPVSPVPTYVMVTMPDGSQQMMPVAQQAAVSVAGGTPDAPSGGFATLGFFFPVVGLILYLVWKPQTPLKARSAGKGALIGVITYFVVIILFYVLLLMLARSLS